MDKKAEGQVIEGEGPAPLVLMGRRKNSKTSRNRNLDRGSEVGVGRLGPGGSLAGRSRGVLCVRRALRATPLPNTAPATGDPAVWLTRPDSGE